MLFISSPFSHKDKAIENARVEEVNKYIAELTSQGFHVFSPITYGTTILKYKKLPSDWKFWKDFCEAFLEKCEEMWVLKLDGWDTSEGVAAEIQFAIENNIKIKYIEVDKKSENVKTVKPIPLLTDLLIKHPTQGYFVGYKDSFNNQADVFFVKEFPGQVDHDKLPFAITGCVGWRELNGDVFNNI